MTRVLFVSPNAGLGMWLSRSGLDVDDLAPHQGESWPADVLGHDVVVLDVGSVELSEQRLKGMIQAGQRVPVVLVGQTGPGWEGLAARFRTGLALLSLPLKPEVLAEQIARLADGHHLDTVGRPQPQPEPDPPVSALSGEPAQSPEPAVPELALPLHPVPEPAVPVHAVPEPDVPQPAVTEPAALDVGGPQVAATDLAGTIDLPLFAATAALTVAPPRPVLARQLEPGSHADASQLGSAPTTREPSGEASDSNAIEQLALSLQAMVPSLYTVGEVADLVLTDVTETTGASAGAALMQSGTAWVVEAGNGLRPLEGRLQVPENHWLIRRIVTEDLGLVVTSSDGSGAELVGVPLASWEHLAAVFLPKSELLILLASADRVFLEQHLAAVRAVDEELCGPLSQARTVRRLAQSLATFALSDYST